MGRFDSSRTRVAPVFGELSGRDASGGSWLERLLALPTRTGAPVNRSISPRLVEARWDPEEKSLPPASALLRWMLMNSEKLKQPSGFSKQAAATQDKRRKLLDSDEATRQEALRLLERSPGATSVWYILEGRTRPDVYLSTDNAVVVIEGKRTETGTTKQTSWLPERDQMLRHLDCAWESRDGRVVYGFYIVESDAGYEIPPKWRTMVEATVAPENLRASLPHRTPDQQQAIANAFLGACTWQQVCREFNIEL